MDSLYCVQVFKDGNMNEFQGDLANINGLKERRKKFNTLYSSFVSNIRLSTSILYSPAFLVTFKEIKIKIKTIKHQR